MKKSYLRLCLISITCFVVGFLFGLVTMTVWRNRITIPDQRQREWEAYAFIYRTMDKLLQGTYNPEECSVREDALSIFKEYESRLEGKCEAHLYETSGGDFEGLIFFPSGDVFSVAVWGPTNGRRIMDFYPEKWEHLWKDTMRYYISP